MILSFADEGTEDIYNGINSRTAGKTLPTLLFDVARRKLDLLDAATSLEALRVPPRNRLEALHGNRKGFHSIRINDQFRVVFRWTEGGAEDVEIVDYH
jgi:proteic killer suppression protein